MQKKYAYYVILAVIFLWFITSYNGLVNSSENVDQKFGQVQNVYQRRADLIPNLVETVKAYASHEKSTFEEVTKARASIGQVKLSPDMTPQQMAEWQKNQGELSSALSKLMMVAERYPDLKASQNFRDLHASLEGTENRISTERRELQLATRTYNVKCKGFPSGIVANVFGFKPKPFFEAEEGAQKAPKVKF